MSEPISLRGWVFILFDKNYEEKDESHIRLEENSIQVMDFLFIWASNMI